VSEAGPRRPALRGVLETAVYVEDLDRSRAFYTALFGLPVMLRDDRFCAFDVAGKDVLLLFRKGATPAPVRTPGGLIPPHDGDGHLHLAFAVDREDLDRWETRLREEGIEIESRVAWKAGGRSVYFRDPDGHLLELATPGVWANY
jgi:catechol 2,3-dioxygenase-like lactoylglutathione lyase family enzyme